MILVDIGNSGLRAAISNQHRALVKQGTQESTDSILPSIQAPTYKLSWSSIGQQIGKQRPDPSSSDHRQWIQIDQDHGYDWLVDQAIKSAHSESDFHFRIASVNRNALDRLTRAIDRCSRKIGQPIQTQIVTHEEVGIAVQVDYPQKVGIDRILAARAAVSWIASDMQGRKRILHRPGDSNRSGEDLIHPAPPVIVVQAGTALTVDWVDAKGCFQGGAILPGVGLALQYLAAGTDQLPWLPTDSIDQIPRLPGKNTEEAIAAGVHASLVGGVRYLVERYRKEMGGNSTIPVVISGGDGRLVLEHISKPAMYVENLVLLGLALSGNK